MLCTSFVLRGTLLVLPLSIPAAADAKPIPGSETPRTLTRLCLLDGGYNVDGDGPWLDEEEEGKNTE
jgi:hypothetical protein